MTDPETRLAEAGQALPPPPQPRGLYVPAAAVPVGGGQAWVHVSGQTCRIDGVAWAGVCRTAADVPAAADAAAVAMRNALAALSAAAGGLGAVCQLVRLRGFVRCSPDFMQHPAVLDGASRVLATAFAHLHAPARTAVGVCSLPDGAWVEVELDVIVAV